MSSASDKLDTLEGLRAIAVSLVIIDHTFVFNPIRMDYFRWWAPGPAGVRVFFVLSGFLITGILLRAAGSTAHRGAVLRAFYARRALRILPLASLALLVACLFDVPTVRERWPWYAAYAINIRMALAGVYTDHGLGHFWSLAIEEQFYLMWPLVVLWVPRRMLGGVLAAMIALAVIVRLALLLAGQPLAAYVLMPARLDALAIGGLLAWRIEANRGHPSPLLWLGGAALVGIGARLSSGAWASSAMEAGMVLISVMLVDALRDLRPGIMHRVIAHPLPVYLGGISYGLYVWQGLVPSLVRSVEGRTGWSLHLAYQLGWSRFLFILAVTVMMATVSWYLLERPLNELKARFPYTRQPETR